MRLDVLYQFHNGGPNLSYWILLGCLVIGELLVSLHTNVAQPNYYIVPGRVHSAHHHGPVELALIAACTAFITACLLD
ncbi:hypothetical protein BDN67DRAFT_962978 [Paxillus ammoniavirescens]|nr:hypothetical protein BDN67DRAFT_962978 [Paxillus ammoniavirescens]